VPGFSLTFPARLESIQRQTEMIAGNLISLPVKQIDGERD